MKRCLAIVLFLMLGMVGLADEIEIGDGVVILDAIDPEAIIKPGNGAEIILDGELLEDIDLPAAVDIVPETDEPPEAARDTANASEDFDIQDGVLVRYNGPGGDVVIPDGVTSIGPNAFQDCIQMTSITIPDSVISIEALAFLGCESLTSITIPDGVISIGDYAFEFCKSLTYFRIPGSVSSIGECIFLNCGSLEEIEVSESNAHYASVDGVLYGKKTKALMCCPRVKTSVAIPDGVVSIAEYAFHGCGDLINVTIPGGVKRIGLCAFSHCVSLTDITLPNSVTAIGAFAFENCYSLKKHCDA